MNVRIIVLGAALAAFALACGGGAGDTPEEAGTADLPPAVAGACAVEVPDCEDTAVGDEPPFVDDEPDPGAEPGEGSSGLVIGGGLTVEEALSADAGGVIAVQGFVVSDAAGIRLCDVLAESMPPQCGGASIPVADLETVDPDELRASQGVTWTDFPVTILGEIVDGTLVPTPASL